jgi:hypothetical protein
MVGVSRDTRFRRLLKKAQNIHHVSSRSRNFRSRGSLSLDEEQAGDGTTASAPSNQVITQELCLLD